MHRPLSHQSSRLAAPIELQGRSVCKSPQRYVDTRGKWDNLLLKTDKSERMLSPQAVAHRWSDYTQAGRTIRPELNNEESKVRTRRIADKGGYENPGSHLSFMKKTGTMDEVYSSKKKYFKESQQTEQTAAPKQDRRPVRLHERKQDDLCSQISTLNSPTYKNREPVENDSRSPAPVRRNNWTTDKRQDFLKSSIASLPADRQTLKSFKDVDEVKILQSAQSPRVARHMASTYLDEPLFKCKSKRDINKQNDSTYEDSNRLHPYSKGKKVAYPQHTEKNTSSVINLYAQRVASPTFGDRYGGMEPMDLRFPGRRMQSPQPTTNTINEPQVSRAPAIGQTLYSYRTFASQIIF